MTHIWLWAGFAVIVAGILAFDLGIIGRKGRDVGVRGAGLMVGTYVMLAILFGCAVFVWAGSNAGLEFFTAYLLEQSLSLDNIFVWLLIFRHLEVPDEAQHKVLFWGIMGAMVLRGIFIFAGTALINAFEWLLYLFGGLVIFSGMRLLAHGGGERDISNNRLLKLIRRHLNLTHEYQGRSFFVRSKGQLYATPLLVALIVIETTDLVFALDSVPAIFGVTRDPFIVYTSNIFAILGLRAMYFVVAGLVERLRYLRYGLALLLVLIGAKMIGSNFVEIPIWMTLGGTVAVLGGSIGLSLLNGNRTRIEDS